MTSAFADVAEISTITIRRADRTIVVRAAPHREPPFDDELDATALGPFDRPLPFERARRHLVVPAAVSPGRATLPDPARWARRLLVGVIETAGGRRPLNQLTGLLSPAVAQGLRSDFDRSAVRGAPHWTHAASIRSVRSTEPAENVAELCATVQAGARVRAVALRLEVRHGRWCCTRLVLG